jgi:hypothetical protein
MLSDLVSRLRSLFRRNTVEAELDDEHRFHFEQQVEKCIRSELTAVIPASLFANLQPTAGGNSGFRSGLRPLGRSRLLLQRVAATDCEHFPVFDRG